ncbi:D-alanyl-D-alanine carboxypeptidase/D-alanyl-D-alanine-endopeptidase [Demequina sp. B12]|uniref:D-alanyl-D-alanine carboxypeptidase/D-alanyl-D-alanine endopeptidase n=1 Tax=Demequina sp. B12 TaxID=2992757 RepID=UPI00237C3305|nr:D-alanyl-D-alanine carboxypeptidase/D-alanyl-D-alanine-endopeptidase [Demequina sp. B12]MDE0573666.1 D-alanyl-D-alanine carboxypeptidase/D-alanyl-D-alanine-endopeptidase [Demequina sp. B12]
MTVGILVPALVVVGVGGYAVADAYDIVPGWVTAAPIPPSPAPFLSAQPVTAASPQASAVTEVSDTAPMPDASAVQELAQALRDDARTGESTNVSVIDLLTGETIVDLDATDTQVPASTTKLLTAVAAVAELGPDYTMTTSVAWDATTRTLTLIAGGDMMLAADAGHGGAEASPNGWAGMGDLTDAVVSAVGEDVLTSGAIRVEVDDSVFEAPAINPEWPQYALDVGYVAPASGLAVNVARKTDEHYAPRFEDPSLAAGDVFVGRLTERGIDAGAASRAEEPTTASAIASVEGAPLWLVSQLLLEESDNTVSEIVSLVHALEVGKPTTAEGAAAATIAALKNMGVNVSGLKLYDGAGFSENNRISPLHLADTVRLAYAHDATADILDWLPISALTGTLDARMIDTSAAGQVRAKTGSLTGVTTLAGAIQTADGRWLAFATLMDGMPYGQDRPKAALDEFLVALAQCGCEG